MVRNHTAVYSLQPGTGSVKWSVLNETWDDSVEAGDFQVDDTAFDEDGNVFLTTSWGTQAGPQVALSRLNNEDGSTLWNVVMDAKLPITTTLGSNKEVYLNGVADEDDQSQKCKLRVFDFDGSTLRYLPCLDRAQYDGDEDVFVGVSSWNERPYTEPDSCLDVLAHSGTDGRLLWNVSFPGGGVTLLN